MNAIEHVIIPKIERTLAYIISELGKFNLLIWYWVFWIWSIHCVHSLKYTENIIIYLFFCWCVNLSIYCKFIFWNHNNIYLYIFFVVLKLGSWFLIWFVWSKENVLDKLVYILKRVKFRKLLHCFSAVNFMEKPQLIKTSFQNYKHGHIIYSWCGIAFYGTVVNRTCH